MEDRPVPDNVETYTIIRRKCSKPDCSSYAYVRSVWALPSGWVRLWFGGFVAPGERAYCTLDHARVDVHALLEYATDDAPYNGRFPLFDKPWAGGHHDAV